MYKRISPSQKEELENKERKSVAGWKFYYQISATLFLIK
jgi:hypothetical protein